jgi:hypothetical protein
MGSTDARRDAALKEGVTHLDVLAGSLQIDKNRWGTRQLHLDTRGLHHLG